MKKETISSLKKEADRVCSLYIRQKDATFDGYVKCFTCGVVKKWQEMDCGHYEDRGKTDQLKEYMVFLLLG